MPVPIASRSLTNPLDRSQASSPIPAPITRTASRVGKKNRLSRPLSTNVPAAAAAASAALQAPLPPPASGTFPSLEEYMRSPPRPRLSNQPNHIITEGWVHVINHSIDDPQSAESLIEGATTRDPTNRDIMTVILAPFNPSKRKSLA